MMKRLLVFAALIAWSGLASAVVYKWTDAQGKLQYGDRPPDGVHAEVVQLLGTHASTSTARNASTAPAQAPTPARLAANPTPTAKDAQDKQAVDQDVASSRDKQCSEAQDRYKKLIEGRRIYKTGPAGERQFMTSEEIDTERLNAKRDIENICNSAT